MSAAIESPSSSTTKAIVRTGGPSILIAGIVNSVVGIGADIAGVAMAVKGFGSEVRESIPVFAYFVSTMFGGAVGLLLLFAMKRSGATKKTFFLVTGILTVISLIPPLMTDASPGTKIVLELLHVVAAAIIIPALAKSLQG
jgi:Family of unknown function (DUF6069)